MQEQNAIQRHLDGCGKNLFELAIAAVRAVHCTHDSIRFDWQTGAVVCQNCKQVVKDPDPGEYEGSMNWEIW